MGYTGDDGLILIGGGGHALVVAEAAAMSGRQIRGFLDDDPDAPLGSLDGVLSASGAPAMQVKRLGSLSAIGSLDEFGRCEIILAIGDLVARRRMIERLGESGIARGVKIATIIHPSAIVSPSAMIEPGVFVGPGAIIHTRARIGAHAIINSGAIVEHECVIGENVHVAPGAAMGGRVRVGADVLVGIGARILPNLEIGRGSTVGAGAVVIRRVSGLRTVVGCPGRDGID
ncbi:MAG: NeuD/PglB/VioB family sugar acetyltransferase [Phycisphaeraceae bacterium]|nr:NeuD/PglB/VioB family sugar acetyltransferase [Phycisphaeraceae bacterium]